MNYKKEIISLGELAYLKIKDEELEEYARFLEETLAKFNVLGSEVDGDILIVPNMEINKFNKDEIINDDIFNSLSNQKDEYIYVPRVIE